MTSQLGGAFRLLNIWTQWPVWRCSKSGSFSELLVGVAGQSSVSGWFLVIEYDFTKQFVCLFVFCYLTNVMPGFLSSIVIVNNSLLTMDVTLFWSNWPLQHQVCCDSLPFVCECRPSCHDGLSVSRTLLSPVTKWILDALPGQAKLV